MASAAPTVTPARERRWRPGWPVDLATTLAPLAHGRADPTIRIGTTEAWRATRTPEGPATVHYRWDQGAILVRAWGPGAEREVDEAPRILGCDDDPAGFAAQAHPVMAAAFARYGAGWRVLRTGRVLEALVPAVLEQRVTGREAATAWVGLVRRFGEPAAHSCPLAPRGLAVPPDGPGWARITSWEWHRAGVDPGRAATIVAAARRARALESLSDRCPADARQALCALPGIGVWTAAEVAVRAWGDVDAVSFGDYHLARHVVHALTGRRDGTDAQLAELLTPWTGQRARAVRMLDLHAPRMPRHAPRATITDHRGH